MLRNSQAQRKVSIRDTGPTEHRLVTRSDIPPSQNKAPPPSHGFSHDQARVQTDLKTTMPSFELGTVLKDVVSRLNSSSVLTTKSSSLTCAGNTTTTGNTSSPIQPLTLVSLRSNIFSQASSEERSGSIFSANFCRVSNHVSPGDSATNMSVENANTNRGVSEITMATKKRSRQQDVARPDAKRVGPYC